MSVTSDVVAVFAVEMFGREIEVPAPGILVVGVVFIVGFYLVNRSASQAGMDIISGEDGHRVGRGPVRQCQRCGRDFQPEQVELLSTGDVRHLIDERCPNCGWDLEWGSPEKPGGASGRW